MNVGKAIYYLLANNANVSAITTRIYPEFAPPDATTPFIAYTISNVQPDDTHDGPAVIDEVRMDVICVDDTYDGAADLASVVRVALDRVYGTYNTVNVESIQFTDANIEVRDTPRQYGQDLTFIVRVKRDDVQIATGSPIEALNLWRLADVDDNIVNALDRQALVYDEATSQWIADGVGQVVIPVRNPNRDPIAIGTVLKATGAQGDRILVAPFNADLDDPRYLVGIASEELGSTAETKDGHAQVYGELRAINTDAYEVGDVLYPDSTGALVTTENQYPIAIVTRKQQNTGRIFIRTWTPGRSRYDADVETLRQEMDTSLANADIELYFSAQADGYGLVESPGSDSVVNSTPAEDYQVERAIYYNNTGLASYVNDSGWSTLTQNTESYAAAKARVEDYIRGGTYGKLPCTFAVVRTEEPARTGLLVDYPGAAAAYSLRLLDTDYTGSAIRVRRASDNAEQNIGFDGNGDLDTTALATFCSGTDGFVKVWYDQAGANDATQTTTTNQPKIYDSATGVVTENGKPAIYKQGLGVTIPFTSALVNGANLLYALVHGPLSDFQKIVDGAYLGPRSSTLYRHDYDSQVVNAFFNTSIDTISNQSLVVSERVATTSASVYTNGVITSNGAVTSGSTVNTTQTAIFEGVAAKTAKIQEIIVYNSDQSANRAGIESNINTYYSIYP